MLNVLAQAPVTEYHRRGAYTTDTELSQFRQLEVWDQVPHGWVLVRALFRAVFLRGLTWWGCGETGQNKVSSSEDPTLMTSSTPDYLLKALFPDAITLGLRAYEFWGDTFSPYSSGVSVRFLPCKVTVVSIAINTHNGGDLWGCANILSLLQPSPSIFSMHWWILPLAVSTVLF